MRLYILCGKSGVPYLAELGLLAGRLADKIQEKFKAVKLAIDQNIHFLLFLAKEQYCFNKFKWFSAKYYCKVVL